jgi:AraC-like DNA-binding protein
MRITGRNGAFIVERFRQYLDAHPRKALCLKEICADLNVAERTLREACKHQLGMGPIRYLTMRRMQLVRLALLSADFAKTTITRVATDHGFWELGHFSVAYRARFGETPSATLQRPPVMVTAVSAKPSLKLDSFRTSVLPRLESGLSLRQCIAIGPETDMWPNDFAPEASPEELCRSEQRPPAARQML